MDRFEIEVRFETPSRGISDRWLKTVSKRILRALGWKKAGLGVLLVGDRKIRSLNRRYLGRDLPTDVMAFSHLEGRKPDRLGKFVPFLGDVVISLEMTKKQAAHFGNHFPYELAFYLCHGVLHLMGYRDKTKKEAARMEKKQKRILREIWPYKKPKRLS